MLRFLAGIGLALVFLLAGYILEGGDVVRLLALTPFLITFFVPCFGVLAVWSFGDWARAWRQAFTPGEASATKVSTELWRFFEFASYLGGAVALLVGGILILSGLSSPQLKWNLALSVALVAPLYGGFLGLAARVLRFRVEEGVK